MTEEEKVKAIADMHVRMKNIDDGLIILGDNIESSVEGILPNISIAQRGFQDMPYIAQKMDVGLDGDQVQVIPLNDKVNYYFAVEKHKKRKD